MASGLSIESGRNFHIWRWVSCLVVVLLLVGGGYYAYEWYTTGARPPLIPLPASAYADTAINETRVTQSEITGYKVPATHPRYISIPALGTAKARVMEVGLTKNNLLDMPSQLDDTAWYEQSAFPGQGYGQVVIDGYNAGVSHNGPLFNLDKLVNGDAITITRGDGKQFTYKVVKNVTESVKDATTTGMQQLMTPSDPDKEGLGLITTAGSWIPRDHQYSERILVWAEAE